MKARSAEAVRPERFTEAEAEAVGRKKREGSSSEGRLSRLFSLRRSIGPGEMQTGQFCWLLLLLLRLCLTFMMNSNYASVTKMTFC